MSEHIYCQECGELNNRSNQFCNTCGSAFVTTQTTIEQDDKKQLSTTTEQRVIYKKKLNRITIILTCLSILLLSVFGIVIALKLLLTPLPLFFISILNVLIIIFSFVGLVRGKEYRIYNIITLLLGFGFNGINLFLIISTIDYIG